MTKDELFAKIRAMNIPGRAKQLLRKLCCWSGRLVEAILKFVKRHPGMEVVALAFAIAYFLQHIPLVGILLGAMVVFLACIVALLEELKHVLTINNNKE